MTIDEKIEYMRIGLSICGYGIPKKDIELFVRIYDQIVEKEGEMGLREVVKLEVEINQKYAPLPPTEE